MNDALKMQMSAFIDGELPQNESELLLRRLSQDTAMRELVAQYLQVGRLMRREHEVPGMAGLRSRIAAGLGESEQPAGTAPILRNSQRRYLKPLAGLTVAASVAVVALVGLRQVDVPARDEGPVAAADTAVLDTLDNRGYTEPAPTPVDRPGEMLTQYYLSHGATSADLGANGILTRLVTLELREGELVEADRRGNGAGTRTREQGDAVEPTGTDDQDRPDKN